ncbi:MAG: hypothetical protein ABI723_14885 [Bacteroidia bacterium]
MKNKESEVKSDKSENLPGYPHYPESEDMMNASEEKRVDLYNGPDDEPVKDATPEIVAGTAADVTDEDLKILGDPDRDLDGGEDETLLPELKIGPDFTGADLDVPGSELDDAAESIGSEDEENNYYSRGQE